MKNLNDYLQLVKNGINRASTSQHTTYRGSILQIIILLI